jgi:hypothetical protein
MADPVRRARLLVVALTLELLSCSPASDQTAEPIAAKNETPTIQSELTRLGGSYEWNNDVKGYVFTDKSAIEKIVGTVTDQTILDLVNCLDNAGLSQTTLLGQPVVVGVLCNEALGQIVYYEPTTESGDLAAHWPGHVEPTATVDQLKAAKRAWTEVVGKRAHKRL